jgi:signal transduction histidine kinase/CheY-like chemotaxis protein/PAS domain-containing protein
MPNKPDFQALFDTSPYPYLLLSAPDLTIIGANPAYLRSTGKTAREIVGKNVFIAFPENPADPESTNVAEVRTSIERAIATKLPDTTPFLRYAVPHETPDGTVFREIYWSAVHTPVLSADGEVAFVAQNAIDVTDLYNFDKSAQVAQLRPELVSPASVKDFNRSQMHEAMTRVLNDERSHLRTLFNQAPGFIAVLRGKTHVFELANEAYYQLLGHRDIIGKPIWQALPDVAGQGFEQLLDGVYETGQPYVGRRLKIQIQREPGGPLTENYIDLLYQPIFNAHGAVTGIFAQGHDVTETERARAALADKVEQLEKSRARQAVRLHLADVLRHVSSANDIFAKTSKLMRKHLDASRVLFGNYDVASKQVTFHTSIVDHGTTELSGTYPAASFSASKFESLENGTTWICEDMAHDPRTSGPDSWPTFQSFGICAGVAVPLSRSGSLVSCMFVNDNKPRKWTDGEVALIEDAAERAWNAVERMRAEDALREADRRKDQFLAMLGHELRNPLAPISAAAELLQLAASDPGRVKSVSKIIARQVGHMTGIVDDLLDVSRVTSGLIVLQKEEVDIKRVVLDAVEQIRPVIETRRHTLSVKTAHGPVYISGDYKRLVQILANLLNNAAKYTPEGGEIVVSMKAADDEVFVSIQDNGIGIDQNLLPSLFELFAQGERSSDRSQGGLGLGLSLVKSLVELHGGRVTARSKGLGRGSEFIICFPRVSQKTEVPALRLQTKKSVPQAGSLRIMVVDDNVDAAVMLALLLEFNGHQVTIEHDPQRALERAALEPFDSFLLDIGLPGMDGTELAHRLRRMPISHKALMVAITGYGQQFDRKNALKAGFDHYFVKPIEPPKLLVVLTDFKKVLAQN